MWSLVLVVEGAMVEGATAHSQLGICNSSDKVSHQVELVFTCSCWLAARGCTTGLHLQRCHVRIALC